MAAGIRYQRRCEVCGKVVEYSQIDKAYAEGKTTVVLSEDDLKSLPEERSKEIEVVEFVPSEQIDHDHVRPQLLHGAG